jgi:hypothetical protein
MNFKIIITPFKQLSVFHSLSFNKIRGKKSEYANEIRF